MTVVHVDFRGKPKAPEASQGISASAPEAPLSFPVPDFLTADCAEEWVRANFRKDALDEAALTSACIRGDIEAVVALMLLSDDERMAAAGTHMRLALDRYAAVDPAARPSARQLMAVTMAHREKGLPLPENWQTDRAACLAYTAEARKAAKKAPPKAPPPVTQDWRPAQPFGARFDVLREVADELGLDPATVAAVDQRLAARLELQATRPVPPVLRGGKSRIAKQFILMIEDHFDVEPAVIEGVQDHEALIAIPKPHCPWRSPIALFDVEDKLSGFDTRKAVTDALATAADMAHGVLDEESSARLGIDTVRWVGLYSIQDRLENDYDGLDLAARLGVGIFVIDEIRSGWDLRFQVGGKANGKTLWSSMSGERLARAL